MKRENVKEAKMLSDKLDELEEYLTTNPDEGVRFSIRVEPQFRQARGVSDLLLVDDSKTLIEIAVTVFNLKLQKRIDDLNKKLKELN